MEATKCFVLSVSPRTEIKVETELKKIGFNAFVPTHRTLRIWKDRKKWVNSVLFNSYVFVESTLQQKNKVFSIKYIKSFVQFEGKPTCLNEKDVKLIHQLCNLETDIEICQEKYNCGQLVEILNGTLAGMRGYIKNHPKGNMLRIEIASLGCFAQVALESFMVRKIN